MPDPGPHASGAPVAVCVLPPPALNSPRTVRNGDYVHEILAHAGLCYDAISLEELPERLDGLRILVTVGEQPLPPEVAGPLQAWVGAGGAWLSLGGLCGMEALLGTTYEAPTCVLWGGTLHNLGEGYLDLRECDHPALSGYPLPLHFFGGVAVRADGARVLAGVLDAHHRPTERPAVLEKESGSGRCLLIAPDVTGSVVRIQQGTAVTRDGVSCPDGTGPVVDGILKSDDGQVLDWLLDRQPVPGAPGVSAFLQPVADQWREVLLRSIFYLAERQGVSLPLLWLYPGDLPALGHLSHDTDGNDPECARLLLEVLERAGAPGTWCVILPGYPPELLRAIRRAGHELATHYDAMTAGQPWSEAELDRQWRELCALFGERPVTNKNHYLRWEGDTELFDWCSSRGIRMDQSKGASKTGEAGFNFGTCHPYRPVAPDGRLLPIFELPTPTQDLLVFAPEELLAPLLEAAVRHHGILHLLFHPAHIQKPGVAEALVRAVHSGRERGLEWWTAARISEWEQARRSARWSGYRRTGSEAEVSLRAGKALPGATVLWLHPGETTRLLANGYERDSQVVERWGFRFISAVLDLRAGETVVLALRG